MNSPALSFCLQSFERKVSHKYRALPANMDRHSFPDVCLLSACVVDETRIPVVAGRGVEIMRAPQSQVARVIAAGVCVVAIDFLSDAFPRLPDRIRDTTISHSHDVLSGISCAMHLATTPF